MTHIKTTYAALAAAVALACGAANAQDEEPGIDVPNRIEATDEQGVPQHDPAAEAETHDSGDTSIGETAAEPSEGASDVASAESKPQQLEELASQHEDLGTFVEAVKAAGLAESLTGETKYTVFAPTDDAFESMSGKSKEELLAPENREELVSLLRAHIVADDVDEEMARTIGQAQTLDGGTLAIMAEEDRLKVGEAEVVEKDIQLGNLRVYAIDKVLSEGGEVSVARADEAQQDPGAEQEASEPGASEGASTGLEEEEDEIALGESETELR